ncbi:hypothetical protein SS209_01299 [Salmonella enterica subsp. enterica serovar Senftenberg str. SS209]|nr:hypothetical protein SS209_01299 [Salmonella enterica subsp. enterica serovar Senftenberg str. SS209]
MPVGVSIARAARRLKYTQQ